MMLTTSMKIAAQHSETNAEQFRCKFTKSTHTHAISLSYTSVLRNLVGKHDIRVLSRMQLIHNTNYRFESTTYKNYRFFNDDVISK